MSTYGNYLYEEDPNKIKPEGTTPSATPTTATGGTTTPPLTYEGFVGTGSGSQAYQAGVGVINSNYDTAVNTATTNRDLGYEYAEGVRNSIYGNAAAQRAEADKNTEVARQRGIIDSKSSYQKAIGAYGSNAETLAGRGLSGSGYGEYLTADAYATHRGQVQNINADALRANREAAYAENQAKMAADSEYLKTLYGINTEHNNAMSKAESDKTQGLYELGLGLNESQNAAYSNLFNSASKGVSIDAIMQDGTWGDLTSEQQQAIIAEAERYATDKSNKERDERMSEYVDLAANGTSLEDIKAMMAINGDTYVEELTPEEYAELSDEEKAAYDEARNFMKLIESAAGKYAEDKAAEETEANFTTAIGLINKGWTMEEVKSYFGGDLAKALGEKNAGRLEQVANVADRIKKDTEGKTAQEQLLTYLDLAASGKYTLDELKAIAQSLGHYDALSNIDENENETGLWAQVEGKFNETESENVKNETLTNIDNAIENGATLEDIQSMPGYDELDDTDKSNIEQAVKDRDEEKETQKQMVSAKLRVAGYTNATDAEDFLASEGVPESERAEYIAQWQSENAERVINAIESDIFEIDPKELVDGLKGGMYGDEAQKVVDEYYNASVNALNRSNITLGEIADLLEAVTNLPSNLIGIKSSEFRTKVGNKVSTLGRTAEPTKSPSGNPIKKGSAITDPEAISTLNVFGANFIEFGELVFWRDTNGTWYEMTYDYSGASGASNGASSNGNVGSQRSNGLDRAPNGKR